MRRSKTVNIADIISKVLQDQGLEDKLLENRLMNSWEKLLGKSISNSTGKMYIKDRVLFVQITSSVVKFELNMIRDDLVRRLNEAAGKDLIDKVVLR